MRHIKVFIILPVLLWSAVAVCGQNFSKAQMTEKETFPESFQFSALNADYVVTAEKGNAQKAVGKLKENFTLPLDNGDVIERIYFSKHADDLFLLYESGNGIEGATQLIRLDGKTNKIEWKILLPTFNTEGVIDGNSGYFAGVGFIAGVSLATGKFVWKHENLYTEKYGEVQIFAVPRIEADKVIFEADKADHWTNVKKIIVDKTTGKILTVK